MKAYQIQSFDEGMDTPARVDLPDPQPGPGQVLIRVRATSLNYRDLMVAGGQYPGVDTPLIPLSDGAGEIVAVGGGVSQWKEGDRVAGIFSQSWLNGPYPSNAFPNALGGGLPGMLAELVVLSEDGVVAIPEHLTFEEAATLPCAAVTAWHALVERGKLAAGQTVLALGTGGVSIFALQIAKMHGARVIITSSSDEKLARARELGADSTINYRESPEWEKAVRELTEGEGAHHILEVGGRDTFPKSLASVAPNGVISVIGGVGGGFESTIPLRYLIGTNANVHGILVGSRAMFQAMNRAIGLHEIKPVVDRVFSFEDAAAAYAYVRSGEHFGKVVIAVD